MEILRDPLWQFVGAVIAVLALIVTVWIYLLQKNRKSLSYLIVTSNELLTASEEIRGRVKITFDKKRVQNVHLLVVKFTNNGNVPILPTDFYEPIKISFGEETKILSADVVEHSPETFDPATTIEGNSLSIVPTLINSRDTFTMKFLLAEYTRGKLQINSRIVGVKAITADAGDIINNPRIRQLPVYSMLVSIMVLALWTYIAPNDKGLISNLLITLVILSLGMQFSLVATRFLFKVLENLHKSD